MKNGRRSNFNGLKFYKLVELRKNNSKNNYNKKITTTTNTSTTTTTTTTTNRPHALFSTTLYRQ